jgi:hypothetical protein
MNSKRKRSESLPQIVKSDDEDTWVESEGKEDDMYGVYRHRGTRSRPLC